MDLVSILIIAAICLLCLLPVLFRAFRGFDKGADDVEGRNPEVARAIEDARRHIDRGRGRSRPWRQPSAVPLRCTSPPEALQSWPEFSAACRGGFQLAGTDLQVPGPGRGPNNVNALFLNRPPRGGMNV